jgi:hypothetical protein
MEENPETKYINAIGRSENRMVDDDEEHRFETAGVDFDREYKPSTAALPQQKFEFSVKSWMTPLIQAPGVIPQIILSLCTVSIATCNKLFENTMPFMGTRTNLEFWEPSIQKISLGS